MKLHTNTTPVFLRVRTCMFLSMERDRWFSNISLYTIPFKCIWSHVFGKLHQSFSSKFWWNRSRNSDPNFHNMVVEELHGNIFEIIKRQGEHHHNVTMTTQQCKEAMKTLIGEFIPKNITPEIFSESLVDDLSTENLTIALKVASKLFRCKIILFDQLQMDTSFKPSVMVHRRMHPFIY